MIQDGVLLEDISWTIDIRLYHNKNVKSITISHHYTLIIMVGDGLGAQNNEFKC